MADRTRLHELVDSLPETALGVAQGALENWQTWPPPEPPQIRERREAHLAKMRQSMRPGTNAGGGGGGAEAVTGPAQKPIARATSPASPPPTNGPITGTAAYPQSEPSFLAIGRSA